MTRRRASHIAYLLDVRPHVRPHQVSEDASADAKNQTISMVRPHCPHGPRFSAKSLMREHMASYTVFRRVSSRGYLPSEDGADSADGTSNGAGFVPSAPASSSGRCGREPTVISEARARNWRIEVRPSGILIDCRSAATDLALLNNLHAWLLAEEPMNDPAEVCLRGELAEIEKPSR